MAGCDGCAERQLIGLTRLRVCSSFYGEFNYLAVNP